MKNKGFTTIELLLYMGILTILISFLSSLFGSIIDTKLEAESTSSVDQDGRYILAKLAYDMQSATVIASPSAGTQGSSLQIVSNGVTNVYGLSGSGNVQVTRNNQTDSLNSSDTNISDLTFRRIGNGDNNDTIQMQFTVTSKIKRRANTSEIKTFKTTFGRHTL